MCVCVCVCVWLCVWARAHAWHYLAHALCRASLLPVDLHMIVRQSFLAQNAVTCAVYAKCLSVGPAVLQEATVGKVTNLMSTDARKMQQFVMVSGPIRVCALAQAVLVCVLTDVWGHDQLFHHSWIQTTIVFCAIAMLYQLLGSAAFAGVGTLCVAMPLQAAVARRQRTVGSAAMKQTDTRVKIVTEILLGIRVIKLYVPVVSPLQLYTTRFTCCVCV